MTADDKRHHGPVVGVTRTAVTGCRCPSPRPFPDGGDQGRGRAGRGERPTVGVPCDLTGRRRTEQGGEMTTRRTCTDAPGRPRQRCVLVPRRATGIVRFGEHGGSGGSRCASA